MKFIFFIFLSISAFAEVSKEVLIQGKVGGYFTEKEVKVIDKFGQSMILPRSAFPKGFRPEQGADFTVEVDPALIKDLKTPKKKGP